MEYHPEYVYFENADGLIDKWCIAADSVRELRNVLIIDNESIKKRLVQIKETDDNCSYPFKTTSNESDELCPWKFVYVDPAFQDMMHDNKELKWTELKIGDVITYIPNRDRYMLVTRIDKSADTSEHIFAGSWLSNDDLIDWEKVDE